MNRSGPLKTTGIFLLSILFLTACGVTQLNRTNADVIQGSGKAATEKRQVSGFSSISVQGDVTLVVDRTGSESLSITADDNLLPLIESKVVNGTLYIKPKDGKELNEITNTRFEMTVKDLKGLEGNGNILIQATNIDTDRLAVRLDGNIQTKVSGRVDLQTVTFNGNGWYNAEALDSRSAIVNINGNSEGVVKVSDKLNATVTGNSTLDYIGSPELITNNTPQDKLRKR